MSRDRPPICDAIWAVSDGRAGLRNQVLGLAEAIARQSPRPIVDFAVDLSRPFRWLPPRLVDLGFGGLPFTAQSTGEKLRPPWPRVLIGCGRMSLPFSLAIRRRSAGASFTVQTQDPRLATVLFDLVIPPHHDGLTGDNVFPILGSPNRIYPALLREAGKRLSPRLPALKRPYVAVLVGGSSKHYYLSEAGASTLADQLAPLAATGTTLLITTSRRTGPQQSRILNQKLNGANIWFWDGDGENPYFGMLELADFIVVTVDSVNMATEAASTGKPIYTLPLSGGTNKFRQFHDELVRRGVARPFEGSLDPFTYEPLTETERAAKEIIRRANL